MKKDEATKVTGQLDKKAQGNTNPNLTLQPSIPKDDNINKPTNQYPPKNNVNDDEITGLLLGGILAVGNMEPQDVKSAANETTKDVKANDKISNTYEGINSDNIGKPANTNANNDVGKTEQVNSGDAKNTIGMTINNDPKVDEQKATIKNGVNKPNRANTGNPKVDDKLTKDSLNETITDFKAKDENVYDKTYVNDNGDKQSTQSAKGPAEYRIEPNLTDQTKTMSSVPVEENVNTKGQPAQNPLTENNNKVPSQDNKVATAKYSGVAEGEITYKSQPEEIQIKPPANEVVVGEALVFEDVKVLSGDKQFLVPTKQEPIATSASAYKSPNIQSTVSKADNTMQKPSYTETKADSLQSNKSTVSNGPLLKSTTPYSKVSRQENIYAQRTEPKPIIQPQLASPPVENETIIFSRDLDDQKSSTLPQPFYTTAKANPADSAFAPNEIKFEPKLTVIPEAKMYHSYRAYEEKKGDSLPPIVDRRMMNPSKRKGQELSFTTFDAIEAKPISFVKESRRNSPAPEKLRRAQIVLKPPFKTGKYMPRSKSSTKPKVSVGQLLKQSVLNMRWDNKIEINCAIQCKARPKVRTCPQHHKERIIRN
eukprot:TRINITY_DN4311_c0_g1_i2.p1 TRINITY_DN4311_c0_g1~~TRINITY_DN4311_c0_g1_i2.p1  ORF type:complete len:701 (-),score=58.10 TRINITY_DN4311_c0_g1_i2:1963-3750(-)